MAELTSNNNDDTPVPISEQPIEETISIGEEELQTVVTISESKRQFKEQREEQIKELHDTLQFNVILKLLLNNLGTPKARQAQNQAILITQNHLKNTQDAFNENVDSALEASGAVFMSTKE